MLFLHGLDSSAQGTKGRWFAHHFPAMLRRDYHGDLAARLEQLAEQCRGLSHLILVGSSFGGLMATIHCSRYPQQCHRLILLAPALNFADFVPPAVKITTPTRIIIGKYDTVTPPDLVLPLAEQTFAAPVVTLVDDDHMLATVFPQLNWREMLAC
ncbi:alpha/beta fold hydrolase [Desulfobulbus alkaliphilus]|nr:alpha/beta fold hydrolase [Desulfobulbus alkaliphilus]